MVGYPENQRIQDLLATRPVSTEAKKVLSENEAEALGLIAMGVGMYTADEEAWSDEDTFRVSFTPRSDIWGSKYYIARSHKGKFVANFWFNTWGEKTAERLTRWLQKSFYIDEGGHLRIR